MRKTAIGFFRSMSKEQQFELAGAAMSTSIQA
jgi:hypothetical protein